MIKKLLRNLFGTVLILYIISVPFFGLPLWVCLIPIIFLDVFTPNSLLWKNHSGTWHERIGDVISILAVLGLGYLRSKVDFENVSFLPSWLQYLLGVAVVDTFGFWMHYVAHYGPKILWKFHKVHHSRPSPYVRNASYEHVVDAIFRLITPGLVLVLFGFDPKVIASVSSLAALVGAVSHLNLKMSIPKPFIWLIVNPITHRIHHHKDEVAVNNGNITHLWDHIMGTYALYDMQPNDYGLQPKEQISDAPKHIFFITLK